MVKHFIFITVSLLAIFISASANATNNTLIRIGGFYANTNSNIDVDDPLLDTRFLLDLEQDLKLEDAQLLPFFALSKRFNDRHNLYLDWKQLHRNAKVQSVETPFQFTWDDTSYDVKVGLALETTLNIDIVQIGYGYDFLQGDRYALGLSVGLHAMFIKTAFEGDIGICDVTTANRCPTTVTIPQVVDKKITAPLPDLGVYGHYDFYSGLQLNGHAQYFYVNLDNLEGSLIDIKLGVEAQITENWHMEAGFNYYEVDLQYHTNINDSSANLSDYNMYYSFTGPMLSVSYSF